MSGYINSCLISTSDIVSVFFITLNSYIIPEEEPTKPKTNFYKSSNLSTLEDDIIYDQPVYTRRRTRSYPNIKMYLTDPPSRCDESKVVLTNKEKDEEWDIL